MIVRTLEKVQEDRTVHAETWSSRRLLLAADGMGFSMHDTVLHPGTTTKMWYRNHVEAVYCISGRGELKNTETGQVHPIAAGTIYALDQHDQHELTAITELRMVCVFNPPLVGPETHDEEGAYPLLTLEEDG